MRRVLLCLCLLLLSASAGARAQDLYRFPTDADTTWITFENPRGEKGAGGRENRGAKGHPAEDIVPGETKVLLDIADAGIIRRIWLTVNERSPAMLRSLRLEMTWDGAAQPAVAAPLGDFFGVGLGRRTPFENALFSDPEGRSFNCNIPMPFRTGARVTLTNESEKPVTLFYEIDLARVSQHDDDTLYFHAHWSHNGGTKLGEDFEILPLVHGRGRFLGCNLGIITDASYGSSWFGEGEVKIHLDDVSAWPSLVGTGTEDYIGTAWGQGAFAHRFQGCLVADAANRAWAFYRYHIPDPVYFRTACRVTIQQMGGEMTDKVRQYAADGAQLIPVTVSTAQGLIKLLEQNDPPPLMDPKFPSGWTNFYRLDNYSSTAYFYLDSPISRLPPLAPRDVRLRGIDAR